jgi:hypothetical protein
MADVPYCFQHAVDVLTDLQPAVTSMACAHTFPMAVITYLPHPDGSWTPGILLMEDDPGLLWPALLRQIADCIEAGKWEEYPGSQEGPR